MDNIIIAVVASVLILGLVYLIIRRSSNKSSLFAGQTDDPSEALTSNVKYEHVDKLIKRDFPPEKYAEVIDALNKYTKGYKATVYSIVIKEANGDIDKVKEYIKIADEVGDYRDLALAILSKKSK